MTDSIRKNHDKYMFMALLPLVFCGSVLYGPRVLMLNAVAAVTAKAVDIIVSMVRKSAFDEEDTSSMLSAVIFCLMLPATIPVYVVVATVVITILVGKHLFGGAGVYPFNLAALAMCCAAVNWPERVFSAVVPFTKISFWSGAAAYTTVSNATILKEGGVPTYGIFQLLLGNYPGTMGADFVIVILVLAAFLIVKKGITWHVPVTFLATCAAIAFLFPRVYGFTRLESVALEMLNGSVFFVALFMLNEPTTTPQSPKAKIIFGFIAGVLGMMFRYFGSFEIGTCFALLIVNSLDRYIDSMVTQKDRVKITAKPVVPTEEEIAVQLEQKAKQPKAKKNSRMKSMFTEIVDEVNGKKKSAKGGKTVFKAKPAAEKIKGKKDAPAKTKHKLMDMNLIGQAEDSLDDVIYSTRTLDRNLILEMEQQQLKAKKKQRKAGNKDEK